MKNETTPKLEDKIMSKIKNRQVKLRSKYIFLAEKLGLESAFALSVVLAALFFNLFFFYLKTTDNLEYLSFGSAGTYAFLESFPYLLVITFVLFLFLAGYLLTKTDFSYKKPFGYFAAGLIIFVTVMGGMLAYTDISERIEEQAFGNRAPGIFFRPFIKRGIEPRGGGVAGKISEIGDDYIIIETPVGAQNINIENLDPRMVEEFKKDQFIMAIGERKGDIFTARAARIMDEEKLPMIRRGIHRRLKTDINDLDPTPMPMSGEPLRYNEETKKCIDDCVKTGEFPEKCFDDCGAVK
ncbi:hypothetical protein KKB41_03780 [Patescibacteria group bacterium]|nr:hypothetical protein [Patescibacteria group bacterium]